MLKRISASAAIVAAFALSGMTAAMAAGQDTSRVVRLDSITITAATRTARTRQDLPVSTSVLRGDEVRATPGLTVDDMLRTIPGLNVPFESAVMAHYTSNGLSMRGLGGYVTTLVLLDGIPLNDPMSGYIQWLKVPTDLVERVEVVRGGNSSLYGTYALGGVVNIITKHPARDEAAGEVSFGSNNTVRANVHGSLMLNSVLRLTTGASYYNTAGYVRPVPEQRGPIDLAGWSKAANGFVQLDYAPSPHSSGFLRANYLSMYQSQGSPFGHDGQEIVDLNGAFQHRSGTGTTFVATGFYQHDAPWTYNADPITARGIDEFVSNYHRTPANMFGGSALWSRLSKDATFLTAFGADAHVVSGDDVSDVYSAPQTFAFHQVGGGTQIFGGAYVQAEYFATPALEFLVGARLDAWQNHNGHERLTPGTDSTYADVTRESLNPRIAIRYRATNALTLRGAVYRAFNAPTLDELYRPYSAQSYANVPNPALGPETLIGGEVGAEYTAGAASVQLNVYQNTLNELINYNPVSFDPVYTTMPVNVGAVRIRGAELFGNWDFDNGLRLAASYTYAESIVSDNPPDTTVVGHTQGDTPTHQAAASVGYFGRRWTGFLQTRYVGHRFVDISNTNSIASYMVTDASASVPVGPNLSLFVQVENLFDKLYVVSEYGFNARGAPRQIFAGVRTNLASGRR